jgi:hypothetical protein
MIATAEAHAPGTARRIASAEEAQQMRSLTEEIKAAFVEAILRFNIWVYRGDAEPSFQLESSAQSFKISEFCEFIVDFENQPLLNPALGLLVRILNTFQMPSLVERLNRDQTYHSGANCLGELIKEKKFADELVRKEKLEMKGV